MKQDVKQAFVCLLDSMRGEGNARYRTALIAAITSTPVREELEASVSHYLENFEDAKIAAAKVRAQP